MHVRLQSWIPFGVQVCLNGRSFLARQMEREGIAFVQKDNTFTAIADVERAQRFSTGRQARLGQDPQPLG